MIGRRLARTVAVFAVTALVLVATNRDAMAATTAVASPAMSVQTATWKAVATTNAATASSSGPLQIPLTLVSPPQYFWITNTGTLSLSSTSVTYTLSASALLYIGALVLNACVGGTWNETANTCVGGTVTQLTKIGGPSGSGTVAQPTAPGSAIRIQLQPVSLNVVVVAQIDVTVTR